MDKGNKISRRRLLRNTANLTAGLVAVSAMHVDAAEAAPADTTPVETAIAPDHDPLTGEIFDRDRHHHWDTV